ncbi:MAG: hypothetical protein ACI86H_001586 [bacterium]|jgi:hypothetical protein
MGKADYKVILSNDPESFGEKVSNALDMGYTLVGGAFVFEGKLAQGVIRYETEDDNF